MYYILFPYKPEGKYEIINANAIARIEAKETSQENASFPSKIFSIRMEVVQLEQIATLEDGLVTLIQYYLFISPSHFTVHYNLLNQRRS